MKLIVQIPCYNEADSIEAVVKDIPRKIDGIDTVEVLLIDDGSGDDSAELASKAGAEHVLRFSRNRGLAEVFRRGLEYAIEHRADIIVNFDGDGQYRGADIPALIAPIIAGEADMVLGARQLDKMPSYTAKKRWLHRMGRRVINYLGKINVSDPVTGFRAFDREAAQALRVLSSFSYTTETLLQAHYHRLRISEVSVETNETPRPSRLFRSAWHFVTRTAFTVMRCYAMYRPMQTFGQIALLFFLIGSIPILRFLWFYLQGEGGGHLQSLVLGASLVVMACMSLLCGILAELQAQNRKMLEQLSERVYGYGSNHTQRDD